ncbi:MAG TPA: DUF4252 domain-containing protein [Thermoanaerobaculia bacterium]|nr:DUF4252 domain-containing protein [Thermoanaerobaculia bacterium]
MKRTVVFFLAALSLSSLLTGCAGAPSTEMVSFEIQRRFPEARFEREEHFHIGRVSMSLLRGLVRMAPGKVDGQAFLNQVRRIEVSSYKVSSLPDLDRIQGETRFESQLAQAGWSMAMRQREEGSRAWMFVRGGKNGGLRNLFVVTLEQDELTLVRIDGRLDKALAAAIAAHPKDAIRKVKGENAQAPAG